MNHEQGKAPIDISLLTKEQFDNEIQKGFSDFENGRTFTAEQVQAQLLKHGNCIILCVRMNSSLN
jgi:predicted transcriptional regulator